MRAVFLDRDNTLIHNDGDLGDPAQVRLVAGAPEALRRLHDAGFALVVVSNQGGVARGAFGEADVEAVHARIAALLEEATGRANLITRFYYCPWHPEGTVAAYRREHPWRKPAPGMLLAAAEALGIELASSWLIGDQARDVAAGRAAGCSTILLAPPGTVAGAPAPDAVAANIGEAAELILAS